MNCYNQANRLTDEELLSQVANLPNRDAAEKILLHHIPLIWKHTHNFPEYANHYDDLYADACMRIFKWLCSGNLNLGEYSISERIKAKTISAKRNFVKYICVVKPIQKPGYVFDYPNILSLSAWESHSIRRRDILLKKYTGDKIAKLMVKALGSKETDIKETVEALVESDFERALIDLRLQRYTVDEISEKLAVDKNTLYRSLRKLKLKYWELIRCEM